MPPKGHKSITVPDEVYEKLWTRWETEMDQYKKQGITSFSGFVVRYLYEGLERETQPKKKD